MTESLLPSNNGAHRVQGIDILRGLVMVLMTLDHTRDFFGNAFFSATDITQTTLPEFLSRWVTHLCAPVFLLLAGSSIWFQCRRRPLQEVRRFVLTRGLMLVLLELTVVHFAWYLHLDFHYAVAGVIWATGWAMVLTALLLGSSRWVYLFAGVTLLTLNPLFCKALPDAAWVSLLFRTDDIVWGGHYHFYTSYPVLPWFGLMCIGYYFGMWFGLPTQARNTRLLTTGIVMIMAFLALRYSNGYGDPAEWQHYPMVWQTICSFVNLEKYPPSPDYCLLLVGIALLIYTFLSRLPGLVRRYLSILGSAPLVYYVLHVLLLHVLAVAYAATAFGRVDFVTQGPQIFWFEHLAGHPEGYGFSLPVVYLITLAVTAAAYPLLRWYAGYKKRKPTSLLRFF